MKNHSYHFSKAALAGLIILFISTGCSKINNSSLSGTNIGENGNSGQNDPFPSDSTAIRFPSVKPNIILILADDLGYEVPTVDGGSSYSTPNIDKMAQDGMRFTQARATPLCSPSRFMLLTGKYSFRNYTKWGVMDLSQKTIANMLKDAGYKTCVTGKWQFDGGDLSIHTFGFDDYAVWYPFDGYNNDNPVWSRYKNPAVYTEGSFWPTSLTNGKYSEDVFMDHLFGFMENNVNNNFFAYCSMMLPHEPFNPTPDDPEFATFNPETDPSDTKYFPSMIAYMDKKVGQLISKVEELGIADKTLIIFVGDNGTDNQIFSTFNGLPYQGGKGYTKEAGLHVPLIVKWPGYIKQGIVNNSLVDLTDFLPTLANLAKMDAPQNYGQLDGVSFYPQLFGANDTTRPWSFCHFEPALSDLGVVKRWTQNNNYKLYETRSDFYDIINDRLETTPLTDGQLTPEQLALKNSFKRVLDSLK